MLGVITATGQQGGISVDVRISKYPDDGNSCINYICLNSKILHLVLAKTFPDGSVVKNPPAIQETQEMQVQSLGQVDPLEKEMATHSNILAWKIPWTEESGGLQSQGSQRVGHNWGHTHTNSKNY